MMLGVMGIFPGMAIIPVNPFGVANLTRDFSGHRRNTLTHNTSERPHDAVRRGIVVLAENTKEYKYANPYSLGAALPSTLSRL
jgi:hypothetical protein